MNRLAFLLEAMAAGSYRTRDWLISAFALIAEGPDDWRKDPYPYRIVQTRTGHFYVDPNNPELLVKLIDCDHTKPIFNFQEPVSLPAGTLVNQPTAVDTFVGNIVWNYIVLIYAFGAKFDFMPGRCNISAVEALIVKRLTDTPKDPEAARNRALVYVDEYLKYSEGAFYLTEFSQLCVPAASRKSITPPPGVAEYRAELLAANKDRLHDSAVIAEIDAKLIAFDAEYLKGDVAEGFLIDKKSRNTVRRKLYLMGGAESGLEESVEVELIPNSLDEGWDVRKFPALNNTLRSGSFKRGAETMLGGESVKWLQRASSNMRVTEDDCGSRLGNEIVLIEKEKEKNIGFSIVTKEGHTVLTAENYAQFAGKSVMMRSPMYCRLDKTDYCAVCVGPTLSRNRNALSAAVSNQGSAFLYLFMAAAHAKDLQLAKMNYLEVVH